MKLALFIVLVVLQTGAFAQGKKETVAKEQLTIGKNENVWMLTYFVNVIQPVLKLIQKEIQLKYPCLTPCR
ncbi:hypothetical protein [Segetibacter aerophilus]|uniref:hypothetical protein n=1 Tax=Segetibacter aerophilus TaxID=670293 RepID=UPI0011BE8B80|nr:hypothetical protein [Segetibacter aerophilus]